LKVLFDTNVVLDLLLDRKPFSSAAAHLFSKVEVGIISGYICATTVTTVHYLAAKVAGAENAREKIEHLMTLFEIAPVNRPILKAALSLQFKDFEDAVLHEAALHVGAHGIVTRDIGGFKRSKIPVYSPEELIRSLRAKEKSRHLETTESIKPRKNRRQFP